MLKTAVIASGSSLQNPTLQVRAALRVVNGHLATRINKISSLYATTPVSYNNQSDFISAICAVETPLNAGELLAELNRIEAAFGRERSFHNASRTLDLDIIDFDDRNSNDPHLTLPHPHAHKRGLVMLLLTEILPAFRLGNKSTAAKLTTELSGSGVRLLNEGVGQG